MRLLALCLCLFLHQAHANELSCVKDAAQNTDFCSITFGPNENAEEALEEEEEEEGSSTSMGCFCDLYSTVFGGTCLVMKPVFTWSFFFDLLFSPSNKTLVLSLSF